MPEADDGLLCAVLEHLESLSRQGLDDTPIVVEHAGVQAHLADVCAKRVDTAGALNLAALGTLTALRRSLTGRSPRPPQGSRADLRRATAPDRGRS